ncbi:hypothetical protein OG233_30040 [Streptomyces sp. NBC_01218]|uniref:hypothetical protein n=1 Tax=unclassified Streptomyces TaxID=2593676 RepID=UPI0023B99D2F|nr:MULTISPECIES: hypothetical protein [unclassified Streptomyces]WEH43413.1 hypothetical protein PZB77_30135 [Streptomyces sp. AM 2-1-1]WSQ55049.1 hypothetical protein OG233_30040 [Streptomyces sp. NBC_01218]
MSGVQSEAGATQNGIRALKQAFTGILNSRQDVQNTRTDLSSTYAGSDGGKYGELLDKWDDQVDIILTNLQSMVDELTETAKQHQFAQDTAGQDINTAYSQADAVFDALSA